MRHSGDDNLWSLCYRFIREFKNLPPKMKKLTRGEIDPGDVWTPEQQEQAAKASLVEDPWIEEEDEVQIVSEASELTLAERTTQSG